MACFDDTASIGTREGWQRRLAERGFTVRGHRLVRRRDEKGEERGNHEIDEIHVRKTMRRHGAKNADYRGGVTCLYDTQLLGGSLHTSGCDGRSLALGPSGTCQTYQSPPSATGPPEGWAAVGFVSPAFFNRGVVGAFAEGFGVLTSDFGVGKSQDLGFLTVSDPGLIFPESA